MSDQTVHCKCLRSQRIALLSAYHSVRIRFSSPCGVPSTTPRTVVYRSGYPELPKNESHDDEIHYLENVRHTARFKFVPWKYDQSYHKILYRRRTSLGDSYVALVDCEGFKRARVS